MLSGFHATSADFEALAGWQASPLEVWIFARFFGGIIVGAEKFSRSHHNRALFTNWTDFHISNW